MKRMNFLKKTAIKLNKEVVKYDPIISEKTRMRKRN
jgi:hypothetical protein